MKCRPYPVRNRLRRHQTVIALGPKFQVSIESPQHVNIKGLLVRPQLNTKLRFNSFHLSLKSASYAALRASKCIPKATSSPDARHIIAGLRGMRLA